MAYHSFEEIKGTGKRVVIRVDFNVPLKGAKVADPYKIQQAIPTINYFLKKNCRLVLLSHLGRPAGKRVLDLSLEPVYQVLKKLLPGVTTQFISDEFNSGLVNKVNQSSASVILLENLRFDAREEADDSVLAKLLSQLGDVYVNDAFADSHRAHCSLVALANSLPAFAGPHLIEQLTALSQALKPVKPAVALLGGIKLETKFAAIEPFLKKYNQILLGGGLAKIFLKAQGYQLTEKNIDDDLVDQAKRILQLTDKIILPSDFVVARVKDLSGRRTVRLEKGKGLCAPGEEIFDIGPETIKRFTRIIQGAKTVIWNGPMGYVDSPAFRAGSLALAQAMPSRSLNIAGGGETLYTIHLAKAEKKYKFLSEGGGAMLEFLAGTKLPGLAPLLITKK